MANNQANVLPTAVGLFQGYRRSDMVTRRRLIYHGLSCHQAAEGLQGLPDDLREAVETVSHYLDHVGVLVRKDLVGIDLVAAFIGGSTMSMWAQMAPFIREHRRQTAEVYQRHFEYLVTRLWELPWVGEVGRLALAPPEAESVWRVESPGVPPNSNDSSGHDRNGG
jgi:hypothetical protein